MMRVNHRGNAAYPCTVYFYRAGVMIPATIELPSMPIHLSAYDAIGRDLGADEVVIEQTPRFYTGKNIVNETENT